MQRQGGVAAAPTRRGAPGRRPPPARAGVLPAPLVDWRNGRTGIAGEVVAAPVVGVRLRPRTTARQATLHHRRPVGVGEREADHRTERHLLDDERLQLKGEVEDAEGRRRPLPAARRHQRSVA